jgi:hypothetical protein
MICPDLLSPALLLSRQDVLSRPSATPKAPGVYAWYFDQIPPSVPITGCVQHEGKTLLYIGISPAVSPAKGKGPSRQSLWHRVRYHYQGNAEGSTATAHAWLFIGGTTLIFNYGELAAESG